MNGFKIRAILLLCYLSDSMAILRAKIDPVSLLWDITNIAVQSKQNQHINKYQNNYLATAQSLLGVLYTVAKNDDHHCVPKLLCEFISSGGISTDGRQSSYLPTFQIDMDSITGLLSSFEGPNTSPILLFGKAALLGYSSKKDSDSCTYAYPRCPKNPEVLLNYLNNHNGGFFRYFNGIRSNAFEQADYQKQNQPSFDTFQYFNRPGNVFGGRLLDIDNNNKYLKFPYNNENNLNRINFFPTARPDDDNQAGTYRERKTLSFPSKNFNEIDQSRQIIYPDRTGTGELILDSSQFLY